MFIHAVPAAPAARSARQILDNVLPAFQAIVFLAWAALPVQMLLFLLEELLSARAASLIARSVVLQAEAVTTVALVTV